MTAQPQQKRSSPDGKEKAEKPSTTVSFNRKDKKVEGPLPNNKRTRSSGEETMTQNHIGFQRFLPWPWFFCGAGITTFFDSTPLVKIFFFTTLALAVLLLAIDVAIIWRKKNEQ